MCEVSWLRMLAEAAEATSKTEVARAMGVSRVSVSLLLNGKYPGDTSRMAARVLERLGMVPCPQVGQDIARSACIEQAGRDMPTSSPAALRQWRVCKMCKFNPKNGA